MIMFHSARLQLTAWYLLIITLICLIFSLLIYVNLNAELKQMKLMQKIRIEKQHAGLPLTRLEKRAPIVDLEVIDAIQRRLRFTLFMINIVIISVSGGASYFLAGRTLKPIQDMVEKQHRFISDASHELRTPLTALKTSIEVHLRDTNLSLAEARELLQENLKEINTLSNLSNNLLTLSTSEHTKEHVREISLAEVIQYAVDRLSPVAKQKEISIETHIEDTHIKGCKDRLQELFTIFVDNAIKYSLAKGTITISSHKKAAHVEISIKDEGMGISQEDLPRIFDRFYRADNSRTHNEIQGYGLGLAIAKEIISAHKGDVKVVSEPKKGTTFTIILPLS